MPQVRTEVRVLSRPGIRKGEGELHSVQSGAHHGKGYLRKDKARNGSRKAFRTEGQSAPGWAGTHTVQPEPEPGEDLWRATLPVGIRFL